jgi:hypothetical protein
MGGLVGENRQSVMSRELDKLVSRLKSSRHDPKKKLTERQKDARDAQLRSQGEDEMRRRWREAEARGALEGEGRVHFLNEVQRWADDAKPDHMRTIRENLGEREAEFRQGIAQEASSFLRRVYSSGPCRFS